MKRTIQLFALFIKSVRMFLLSALSLTF